MVQLPDDLVHLLDAEAADRGMSRSAIIREAVERHLGDSIRARMDPDIVAGYQRIPQAEPDEWGASLMREPFPVSRPSNGSTPRSWPADTSRGRPAA